MKKLTLSILGVLFLFPQLAMAKKLEKATFAGGCFWCMEPPFEKLDGVTTVISGFSGGSKIKPSYNEVAKGSTKHLEVVQVTYDPKKVSYEKLLKVFWVNINPTDAGGQFVDRGHQYSTAIFFHNKKQETLSTKSKDFITKNKYFKKPIVTPIRQFKTFYPAQAYHQDFYKQSLFTKTKYKYYRANSGRDQFIEKNWTGKSMDFDSSQKSMKYSKPSNKKIKSMLTDLQYRVTQKEGTERAFKNKYWDNKEAGIYVDIVSGEPLFSSLDKYQSKTGWPSFSKPLEKKYIVEKEDNKLFRKRIEVRSKFGDSHLGHIFPGGPAPTYQRYCINSAALRFIKKADLKKEGFAEYIQLFDKSKGPK